VYLPGSFNPLHHGHEQLLEAAASVAGPEVEGAFELSVGNADKVGRAGLSCIASAK
jgi:phosphopantetheine adenylyltransferase